MLVEGERLSRSALSRGSLALGTLLSLLSLLGAHLTRTATLLTLLSVQSTKSGLTHTHVASHTHTRTYFTSILFSSLSHFSLLSHTSLHFKHTSLHSTSLHFTLTLHFTSLLSHTSLRFTSRSYFTSLHFSLTLHFTSLLSHTSLHFTSLNTCARVHSLPSHYFNTLGNTLTAAKHAFLSVLGMLYFQLFNSRAFLFFVLCARVLFWFSFFFPQVDQQQVDRKCTFRGPRERVPPQAADAGGVGFQSWWQTEAGNIPTLSASSVSQELSVSPEGLSKNAFRQ